MECGEDEGERGKEGEGLERSRFASAAKNGKRRHALFSFSSAGTSFERLFLLFLLTARRRECILCARGSERANESEKATVTTDVLPSLSSHLDVGVFSPLSLFFFLSFDLLPGPSSASTHHPSSPPPSTHTRQNKHPLRLEQVRLELDQAALIRKNGGKVSTAALSSALAALQHRSAALRPSPHRLPSDPAQAAVVQRCTVYLSNLPASSAQSEGSVRAAASRYGRVAGVVLNRGGEGFFFFFERFLSLRLVLFDLHAPGTGRERRPRGLGLRDLPRRARREAVRRGRLHERGLGRPARRRREGGVRRQPLLPLAGGARGSAGGAGGGGGRDGGLLLSQTGVNGDGNGIVTHSSFSALDVVSNASAAAAPLPQTRRPLPRPSLPPLLPLAPLLLPTPSSPPPRLPPPAPTRAARCCTRWLPTRTPLPVRTRARRGLPRSCWATPTCRRLRLLAFLLPLSRLLLSLLLLLLMPLLRLLWLPTAAAA